MLENVELTILAIACLPTNPTASIQLVIRSKRAKRWRQKFHFSKLHTFKSGYLENFTRYQKTWRNKTCSKFKQLLFCL